METYPGVSLAVNSAYLRLVMDYYTIFKKYPTQFPPLHLLIVLENADMGARILYGAAL